MFTSCLRRQSPALLRLTPLSIRALTSCPSSSKSSILRSVPLKTAVLNSSSAQRRFFAISTYLRDEANATAEAIVDLDPPAGEYAHSGLGHVHHFKDEGPITKFQQLTDRGLVKASLINTITKGLGYDEMTKVQQKTILETLKGENVLAQAKTGTGKTIAFLLPVMQRLLTSNKPLKVVGGYRRGGPGVDQSNADIRAIIVSPTRELASQIAVDAKRLAANTQIVIGTAVGGSGKQNSLREIHRYGCHILIATPGRLLDLLTDPRGVTAPNLEIFVMDEADNLLDVGFAKELDNIMAALPPRDRMIGDTGKSRQTLLFSATVPDKVMSVVKATMGNSYKFLRMVEKGESQFHERVEQRLIKTSGLENLIPATYELCERERAKHNAAMSIQSEEEQLPFKAIVFFSATRWASLAAETFRSLRGTGDYHPMFPTKVFEIHSRLSQGQRDVAATRFRSADSAILFSSDVTARGMDFPKVTHVIQVGGPRNKEQYIHRLGRTARGSREGAGYLLLPDMELSMVLRELRGLPFIEDKTLSTARLDLSAEQTLPKSIADILTTLTEASMRVPREFKSRTYSALLGVYSAIGDKSRMVDGLNRLSTLGWGMEEPPYVSPMLARKMGLERTPGLNTTNRGEDFDNEGSESGYGGRGGGGFSRGGGGGGFSRGGYGGGMGRNDGGYSGGGGGFSRGGFSGRGRGGFGNSEGRGDFGSSGGRDRPWEGRGRQASEGFSRDRESFGGRGGGGRGRGGFGGGRGGFGSSRAFSSRGRDSESDSFTNRGRDSELDDLPSGERDGESDNSPSSFSSRGRGDSGGFSSRGRGGESGGFSSGFSSRGRGSDSGGFSSRGRGGESSFSSRGRGGEFGGFSSRGRGSGFGGRGRGGEFGGYSNRGRDSESGGFGGRPSYGDNEGGSFSGRGGFGGRGRGRGGDSFGGGERRSFGDRDNGGERRSFGDRDNGGERRSFGDRDGGSRDFGGEKPWEKRGQMGGFRGRGGFSSRGGSSSFGGRPSYGDSEGGSFGGRGGFGGRGRGRGGDSFGGGERRSFGDRDNGGERRSFGDRDGGGERRSFGDRDGGSKGFGDRGRGGGGSGGGMSRFDAEE